MTILEAHCRKCGESFVPADEGDLIHGMKDGGSTPCGGRGQIAGEWSFKPEPLGVDIDLVQIEVAPAVDSD